MSGQIRPIALAVIRRGDELLVTEGTDEVKRETFYRPLGGGIDLGEPAEIAVRRELIEEISAELEQVRLLGVTENIFTYRGSPGHEIVFVFDCTLADPAAYDRADLGHVLDSGERVLWKPLSDFTSGALLHPHGLLDLISAGRAQSLG